MKKSFYVITLFLLFGGAVIFLFFKNYSQSHGSLSGNVRTAESRNSEITFKGSKGDNITVNFSSNVKSGKLNFSLTDQEGTIIETFPTGVTSSKKVVLDKNDTYSLWLSYENYVGNYHLAVNK